MAPAPIGALADLESLRWLRTAALHSLFSICAVSLWCFPSCFKTGLWPILLSFLSASCWVGLLLFLSAQALFLAALKLISEPEHSPSIKAWGTIELLMSAVVSVVGGAPKDKTEHSKEWAKLSSSAKRTVFAVLVAVSAVGGVLGFGLLRQGPSRSGGLEGLEFGAILGLFYATEVLISQRYVLHFPPIQRPWYLRLKQALKPAASRSLVIALPATILSEGLHLTHLSLATREGSFFGRTLSSALVGTLMVFCWEMGRSLAQVILTERHLFTPPPNSVAETAPADVLITALQTPKPLTRHLAFLDLCLVAESRIDTWRRVAVFRDDTGDCYKKAIGLCLEPLKELVSRVTVALGGAGAAGVSEFRPGQFQLQRGATSSGKKAGVGDPEEIFAESQICSWGARAAASLTAASRKEDEFGVAQLSGSNADVISTLLSALLAIETAQKAGLFHTKPRQRGPVSDFVGSLLMPQQRLGASFSRASYVPSRAFALSDVIRVALHVITQEFADIMLVFRHGSGLALDDRDWLPAGSPEFGTKAAHVERLRAILDFRE